MWTVVKRALLIVLWIVIFILVVERLRPVRIAIERRDMGPGDDSRPPIIVSSGSVIFESGDASRNTKWKPGTPPPSLAPLPLTTAGAIVQRWRPDQPNGASVRTFTVTVTGYDSATCPLPTLSGDVVEIDYFEGPQLASQAARFVVSRVSVPLGGRFTFEPEIASTKTLTHDQAHVPPRLIYDRPGSLSRVTVAGVSCGFTSSATGARIQIQPER